MKSNLIICTVGTSFLQQKENIKSKKFPSTDISAQLALRSLNQATIGEKLSEEEHPFNRLFEELKNLKPNTELGKRGENYNPKNPDFLPAELSSLYLFYWPDGNVPDGGHETNNKDTVVFLPSETNDSIFCACCLQKYLEEKEPLKSKISVVKIRKIEGLQTKDTKRFEETALLELSRILREEIDSAHKKDDNVVLNITGGYKSTPPYVTVIGNCFPEVDIIYLYEDSKNLVHLPPIPISFDLPTYRDYRAIINVLAQPGFTAGKFLYKALPPNIKACFFKKRPEMKLNFFGETIIEKYKNEKISLTPYGKGLLLLDRIKDSKLKEYLKGCINQWQHIWIGDKIPEMVEHQRGHTQRVLELAAELLYSILEENGNFLNDTELASLIGAIWLHDLGHSGERFKINGQEYIVKGFPSLIRDFHNLITYTILEEEEDKIFPERVEIAKNEWETKNGVTNIEDIFNNIKIISKYHRKWTPLISGKIDNEYKKHCIKLTQAVPDNNKLQFLTALYRVLDACDTQIERTVDDAYIDTRKRVVNREVKILLNEKERLECNNEIQEFIKNFDKDKTEKCANINLNSLSGNLSWILKEGEDNKGKIDKYADCINCIVGNIKTCPDSGVSDTVKRWISCLDQILFKKRQPLHYEKHKGISAVMILPEGRENNVYKFNILVIEAEPEYGENKNDIKERKDRLEKVICEDIISEYEEAKVSLDKYLRYKFSYQLYDSSTPEVFKEYDASLEC